MMSTDDDQARILRKVRKLYRMAHEFDASPREAEIALRQCLSMMDRHGIGFDDLKDSEFGAQLISAGTGDGKAPQYKRILGAAVAELHDCLMVRMENGALELRGYKTDVTVAHLTFDYLVASLARSMKRTLDQSNFPDPANRMQSYRIGYAVRINERIGVIIKERLADSPKHSNTGQSLALAKMDNVVQETLKNASLIDTDPVKIQIASPAAAADGYADGGKASLSKQLDNEQQPQLEKQT